MKQKSLLQRIDCCIPNRVPVSIYLKDKHGVYQWCNPYKAQTAGLKSNKDIVGKTDDDLPWHDQADHLHQIDRRVMTCGALEYLESWTSHYNKTEQVFLTAKSPCYDDKGYVSGVIGISIDITRQKRLRSIAQSAERIGASLVVNQGNTYHSNAEALFYSVKEMVNLATGFMEITGLNAQSTLPAAECFSLQAMLNMSVAWITPLMVGKGIICHMLLSRQLPHSLLGQPLLIHRIITNLLQNSVTLIESGQVIIQADLLNFNQAAANGHSDKNKVIPTQDVLKLKIIAIGKRRVPAFHNHQVQMGLRFQIVKKIVNLLGGKFELEKIDRCSKIFTCLIPIETYNN